MTTFSYTTGNPSNLTAGGTASMNDIQGSLTDLRTFLNGGNQDSTNIAAGPTLIATQQAWQTLALAGSTWTPANLSYYKDSLGLVHFRGEEFTTSGNVAATTTLCTLPTGYRPGTTQRFLATSGGGVVLFTITTAGVVSNTSLWSQGTAGAPMSFGAVHFRAEN